MRLLLSELNKIPDYAGIYFICKDDEILYIGRSNRLYRRITLNAQRLLLFKAYNANNIRLLLCITERSIENFWTVEANLIKRFKPILNIKWIKEKQTKEERAIKRKEYMKATWPHKKGNRCICDECQIKRNKFKAKRLRYRQDAS